MKVSSLFNFSKKKTLLQIAFFLLILCIIIFVICSIFSGGIRGREGLKLSTATTNEWVILLTTCVSPTAYGEITKEEIEKRKEQYERSIRKWVSNTRFPIFVVESSGYPFDNLKKEFADTGRLTIYSFVPSPPSHNSSVGEYNSLVFAIEQMKNTEEYKKCKYVMKVTGKYFLEGIEKVLEDAPKDKDMYLQQIRHTEYQHSEYFGMKKEVFDDFLKDPEIKMSVERYLYHYSDKSANKISIGPFKNDDKIRQADGSLLSELFQVK